MIGGNGMNPHRIIAGGTGFIGQHIVHNWLAQNIKVTVISRKKQTIHDVFGSTVNGLTWDEFEEAPLPLLHSSSLVVNLTGASLADKHWSNARKQEIIGSRMRSTKLLSNLCAIEADRSPMLFNASAIGVYGLENQGKIFDEDTAITFEQANDFLAQVARPWESATAVAKAHGVHVINMRFGVVLGKDGGMLKKLMLPYKMGLGGTIGTGIQPITWIHIDDIINIIEFLTTHPELHGGINFTAPQWVTQTEFAKILAKVLHRPCILPTPAKLMQLVYGEMANELLLAGQAVYPKRLLEAGYQFKFPDLTSALENLLR
jgi:uncharacterized protein (TIGR01777 family)